MNGSNGPRNGGDSPVYLVIGANGGVGCDLTMRLANRGARVVLAGRNMDELSVAADSIDAPCMRCDVTDFEQVRECIQEVRATYGRLDGVANCAGSLLLKPAHLTTEEEWLSVIAVNLSAAFATVKYASKVMMERGGSIVLVSSCAAHIGLPNHEAIAAAKAGIEGLVRSAAATYARHQIRVNCVAPGLLKTGMSRSITSSEAQMQASNDMHPLGRIGNASDVSVVIDWLLGDDSTWVTGQRIGIDGGLSSVRSQRVQRRTAGDAKIAV